MNWLQRHAVEILYITFIVSFLIMVVIIVVFCYFWAVSSVAGDVQRVSHQLYITEYPISLFSFFGAANALVVFRVFNLNIFTILFHAIIFICILIAQLLHVFLVDKTDPRDFTQVFQFPTYFLISLYILQMVLALHLVVFRPGRTLRQREIRSGIHAFIGLMTFFVQLWNVMLHVSMLCANPKHIRNPDESVLYSELLLEPSIMAGFMLLYVLIILFILLTPYFEAETRGSINEESADNSAKPSKPSKPGKRRSKEKRRSSSQKRSSDSK